MIKIIEEKHVEDCFDGSSIFELMLSEEITKELIFTLRRNGTMQYFDNFERPFFKIRVLHMYDIKGIEGNKTMRIHLKNPQKYSLDDFKIALS